MTPTRIVRRRGLQTLTSLSPATLYRLISRGEFPRPIRLSSQAVGWDINDVQAWIETRKAGLKWRAAQ